MSKFNYQTHIDSPEGLNQVIIATEQFCSDRLFCALAQKRRFQIENVLTMDAKIMAATAMLKLEYAKLVDFSDDFNDQFVTEHNDYFTTAELLLKRLKTSVSVLNSVYKSLAPNNTANLHNRVEEQNKPYVYGRSAIGSAPYTGILFPDYFTKEVVDLAKHMKEFFDLINDAFKRCIEVIEEENEIKKDPMVCCKLYHDFKDSYCRKVYSLLNSINLRSGSFSPKDNQAIFLRESSCSEEEFSQQGYHSLPYGDVCNLVTKEIIEETNRGEFSAEELELFYDQTLIPKIRCIIKDFDKYLPEHFNGKKLPADLIALLMYWSSASCDLHFVNYFKKMYTEYGGALEVPSNGAVNHYKKLISDDIEFYYYTKNKWNQL